MKNSIKRSRKSKLVPRECLDSDDENIVDMQNEIEQTIARMTANSILKKLNRHTEEPLKFSVKVEVEEVDEPCNTYIKEEEIEKELNITIDSVVSLKEPNTDNKKLNSKGLLEKSSPAAFSKGPEVLQCLLKDEMIRNEFDRISKQTTSKADKLIEIHILNFFGRHPTAIKLDDKELQLQSVIGKWKSWHKINPIQRDVPSQYKCYICSKAWWHYYDFRQHFHNHNQVKLDIETCGKECGIIIYQNEQPFYNIPIDESCWQCGQDFALHRVFQKGNKKYKCKGCLAKFTSCMMLNQHLGNCQFFKRTLEAKGVNTNDVFTCELCPVKYFSEIELEKHLRTRHSVRSDLPVVINVRNCPTCNRQLIDLSAHECENLLVKYLYNSCKFCKRNFQKVSNLQMHETVVKKNHKCIICGKVLLSACMELEHLLSHSDTYSIVYKCKLCPNPVYFVKELLMKKHRFVCHRHDNIDVNTNLFETIVVPKTLLKSTPLKTYLPKVKSKGNINDQGQENFNECDASEMGTPDFNECDSVNDNTDEKAKSEESKKNTNIDKALTNIEAISTNIKKGATNIYEVLTDVDEVASFVDKIATNVDEVATGVDMVASNIAEESTNIKEDSANIDIESKNIEPFNKQIKKEKLDIEDDINEVYSTEMNIKQEPMDIDYYIDRYNDNMNNIIVKEQIVEHGADECDLKSEIKIEVKNDPINDMINDNAFDYNDTNDEDFQMTKTFRIYSCKKCSYQGVHRQYKKHIKEKCQTSYTYTCTKCNSTHQCMKDYLTHFEHHNYEPNTCPKCLKQFPNCGSDLLVGKFVKHVFQHIKNNFVRARFIKEKTFNKAFQCRHCRENVASSDFFVHWESHIEIKNLRTGSETIDLLKHKPILLDVIALLQGEPTDTSKELLAKQCVMCLKNFSRKNDLKRHFIEHLLRDAYANKEKYECLKCQICNIGFNKIDIYKRHMRDHACLPLYKCEICDKTFSDSSNFSKHKKVHNLSVLICDICKKKFTCKAYLIKHMEMHDKLKPIVCKCCRRVFHSASLYRKHCKGLQFKCPVCFVTFDALKHKWDHMWLEHKERKYLADCPICKKSFRKFQDVKKHIKTTHDTEYVYKAIYKRVSREEIIVCE